MTNWNPTVELAEWCRLSMPFEAASISPDGRWGAVSMSESCGIVDLRPETGMYELARLGWEDYDKDDGTTYHALGTAFGADSEFVAFTRENEVLAYATPEYTGEANAVGWDRTWSDRLDGTVTDVSVGAAGELLGCVTAAGELSLYGNFPDFPDRETVDNASPAALAFVAVHPERELVLSGGDARSASVRGVGEGELASIESDAPISDGYWLSDDEFVLCDRGDTVYWCSYDHDSRTIAVEATVSAGVDAARAVRITDDGSRLLVGGDGGLAVFDVENWDRHGRPPLERTLGFGVCRTLAVGRSVLVGGGDEDESFLKLFEQPDA
ncbi:hypothetical protein [Natrarchaeobius oligotrophus]|uniref:WD40 repeat domain-containing protein n=1 Tax=Natrarchaeobius chitinivorans TaxID=1679083 RepID=A0A3N6PSV0_NATCH|nr:hypothetical protein [Natrarchaeobius chitinivorans]RQH02646.1 hypothetical protein EA472_04945 [Natrarchaeobius chitinivorans]